jgi:hypothetical protein
MIASEDDRDGQLLGGEETEVKVSEESSRGGVE